MTKRLIPLTALFAVLTLLSVHIATDAFAKDHKKGEHDDAKHNVAPEGWTSLFNGKDIEGWVVKSGKCTFEVHDGMVTGTTVKGSPNTFLCTSNEFADFELKFDVLLHDNGLNSGVQIRSKVAKEGEYGGRIGGPQVEVMRSPGRSGLIYGEFTERKWMSPNANQRGHKHFKNGEWNTFHVIAKGNNIKTYINGEKIEDLDLPEEYHERFKQGVIGLQVHSVRGDPKWKVSWRNMYIKEIK